MLNIVIAMKLIPQTGMITLPTKKQMKKHIQKRFLQTTVKRIQQNPVKTVAAAIFYAQMTIYLNINITPQTSN